MTVSENDFFQLIESLPYGVYIVKPDRTIVYWNREAECITGYGAEEMVGRRCPDTELNHMDEEGTPLCKTYCPPSGLHGREAAGGKEAGAHP